MTSLAAEQKNQQSQQQQQPSRSQQWEERIQIVRQHFIQKGYRVHSGLQFGCELVLYADDPTKVHSDFCVHVVPEDGSIDWRTMQTLVRSMPDLHKTLILSYPYRRQRQCHGGEGIEDSRPCNAYASLSALPSSSNHKAPANEEEVSSKAMESKCGDTEWEWVVDELAIATEHAPFRHRHKQQQSLVLGGGGIKTPNNSASTTHSTAVTVGRQRKRQKR